MAKIKVFFDARFTKSDENREAPLKLAVTNMSRTAYIPLNIAVKPSQWDKARDMVVGHPQRRVYNEVIRHRLAELQAVLIKLEQSTDVERMTANEVRDKLLNMLNPELGEPAKEEMTLGKWFAQFMSHKADRTRSLYEVTWRRIEKFMGKKVKSLKFEDINKEWLTNFDEFMAQTAPSANARNIHLRNLRAVFNDAIDNEITTNYPFRRFKIKPVATRKRNLPVEEIRSIFSTTKISPWMVKYRDFFALSFMLIGINVVDLCGLKEVKNGRIEYIRAKTKKAYDIKVEPEAAELIAKYKGDKGLLNFTDNYKSYRHFYNNLCKGLRGVRDTLGLEELTTYWARHSWATIAASLDIPKDTIAAALGHGGNTVTDIYIEFDMRKVDVANRRVLDWVLYGKR